MAELQVYDVNFGTTKYEHSVLRKYFLKTAVSDRGSISLWFSGGAPVSNMVPPKAVFQRSIFKYLRCLLSIELLGVGTDPLQGRFQLPTPNNSIGPSEVARGCFKVGCFRLPLVGGRFLKMKNFYYSFRFSARKATAAGVSLLRTLPNPTGNRERSGLFVDMRSNKVSTG